jgi:hypothetical protein
VDDKKSMVLGQGISEILAMDDQELLVLERSAFTSGSQVFYNIKLYQVSVAGSSKNAEIPASATKQLVFDFSSLAKQISDGRGLDNFEGMAWGPDVGGKRTLLFVSDDNFSPLQRTVWLALIEK